MWKSSNLKISLKTLYVTNKSLEIKKWKLKDNWSPIRNSNYILIKWQDKKTRLKTPTKMMLRYCKAQFWKRKELEIIRLILPNTDCYRRMLVILPLRRDSPVGKPRINKNMFNQTQRSEHLLLIMILTPTIKTYLCSS